MTKETLDKVENDPDFIAYQEAKKKGLFDELPPGTYVVFHKGVHVGTGPDREKLIKGLLDQGVGSDMLVQPVNLPEKVYQVLSPHVVKE